MAIMMLKTLAGPNWIMEAGEVYDLGALQEHHWIAAGHACEWTEDDQRRYEESLDEKFVNIDLNVTQNGLSIDSDR
ncbi:hypothetical protein [Rubinisphaera brasiliensis]|uniref:Uncharacterized protein n=1 Tax=Rubinisphaera brasiliensis (strain ATCC 49424 / DSM 5305 / JCM 21570 / IAM 15109 / NBRC 103401 / IFAM 1448) TaxID=756272 RepID=F0SQR2_RUBBR|nr:hypothetical protein [Rubinisphaera brasiliensis]ADY59092.1 hypothetical protein Plabr_1481 [Rubinisphaera brasiliensis DSM 5305]